MPKIIIAGGGMAGVSAAIAAKKAGAEVAVLEKNDMLLGGATRAGGMDSNGKYVGAIELKALGGGEVFEALESIAINRGTSITEENTYTYNTAICEPLIRDLLERFGIEVLFQTRAIDVDRKENRIISLTLEDKSKVSGDCFIDASGTSGGIGICTKYGMGCMMCIHFRCPVFGDRISIATKAGLPSRYAVRPDGTPGMLGAAVTIYKETIDPELRAALEAKGAITIPLPTHLIDYSKQHIIGAVRPKVQMENLNLRDIGPVAKCIGLGFMALKDLRSIKGLEKAEIEDPLGGNKFNRIHKVDIGPVEESLKAVELENLFCCGEKAGNSGVNEAIISGYLAGHNSVRAALNHDPLILPRSTACGDYIAMVSEQTRKEEIFRADYSMRHGLFFDRMKERGLYTKDSSLIRARVEEKGLTGIFSQRL